LNIILLQFVDIWTL